MTRDRRLIFWLVGAALLLAVLHVLDDILLPFVVGLALAYLLDPLADLLESWSLPRWLAAALITLGAIVVVVALILLLLPLLQTQLMEFAGRVPQYLEVVRERAVALLEMLQARLSAEEMTELRNRIGAFAGQDAVAWLGGVMGGLWSGGAALLNLLSLVVVTPIVTFYLLRDWDGIITRIDEWLPRRQAATIRGLVAAIDRTLAGFARGQFMVCAILGAFYGLGLSLIGLDFGLVIGLATGLISFVPFFGMLIGFVTGIGVALAQFGPTLPVGLVAAVFLAGQFIEGNFITPRLIGNRVGLHPVWMIFALLAGGALFGLTGVLLAVPVAAIAGVLIRFALECYLTSDAYGGGSGG